MRQAYLKEIEYYLPESTLSNENLSKEFPEWGVEKIANKTGIKVRHIAKIDETSLDLAVKAGEKFFKKTDVKEREIDFLLFCTQTPDYFLPTTACILQDRLGLSKTCGALDINLGCSGFVYGLGLAKGLIIGGLAKNILLFTADTYSKIIEKDDKGNRTIFGDGAAVSFISADENPSFDCSIGEFTFGTDGNGANHLIVRNGAFRNRCDNGSDAMTLFMDGPSIFTFTIKEIPSLVSDVLRKNNLNIQEIDLFVFHQANKFMLEHLRKRLNIPEDKFFIFIEKCGNTVSSTIPIALSEARKLNLKKNSKILIAGFGVGLSWGATVLSV